MTNHRWRIRMFGFLSVLGGVLVAAVSTANAQGYGHRPGYGQPHHGGAVHRPGYGYGPRPVPSYGYNSYYSSGGYGRPYGYSSSYGYGPGRGYSFGSSYYGGGSGYSFGYSSGYCR